jgi:hypothetical protein
VRCGTCHRAGQERNGAGEIEGQIDKGFDSGLELGVILFFIFFIARVAKRPRVAGDCDHVDQRARRIGKLHRVLRLLAR